MALPLLSDIDISAVMTFVDILKQILDCSNSQTHFKIYVADVLLADVWVVGNHLLHGYSNHTSTRNIFLQCHHSAHMLWITSNIDFGFITETKWKILVASIVHHTWLAGIVFTTWSMHHLGGDCLVQKGKLLAICLWY